MGRYRALLCIPWFPRHSPYLITSNRHHNGSFVTANELYSDILDSLVQSLSRAWLFAKSQDSLDCNMTGFPVHHQLPEFAQTHVHRVGITIQPSHPLLSPSPPAFIMPSIKVFSNDSVISVQSLSRVRLFVTPMDCSTPGIPVLHQLSVLAQTHVYWVGDAMHLILCHPLLLQPSIFPSIKVFSNESVLHIRWPKYWSFSFSISPSNEHSGLISFRMD